MGSGEQEMIQPSMNEKEKKHILYSVDKINWRNVDNFPLYIFLKKEYLPIM